MVVVVVVVVVVLQSKASAAVLYQARSPYSPSICRTVVQLPLRAPYNHSANPTLFTNTIHHYHQPTTCTQKLPTSSPAVKIRKSQLINSVHPQIMKNHKQGMTMAHVLQQGLWGEGILHSEHL